MADFFTYFIFYYNHLTTILINYTISTKETPVSKPQTKSLGQVAKQIGISRPYLSERLHVELPGHPDWPALQKINGSFVPVAFACVARLAMLDPKPIYEINSQLTAEEAYAAIVSVAFCLARVVGIEGEPYRHPLLERKALVNLLRACGDALSVALDGLEKPAGYHGVIEDADQDANGMAEKP